MEKRGSACGADADDSVRWEVSDSASKRASNQTLGGTRGVAVGYKGV